MTLLSDKFPMIVAAAVAAVSLLTAIWYEEGMMIGISVVAVCITVPAAVCCPRSVSVYSLAAASAVLVCTVLIVTAASAESLVDSGMLSRDAWSYVTAAMECLAVIPLVLLLFFVTASAFGASYNWVLVSGLSFFVGPAMILPGHAVIFFTQLSKIDSEITKTDVVAELLMSMVVFILVAMILCRVFRKRRLLITKNGLERMQ